MQYTACLVFNPIMVECYGALFSCLQGGGSGLRLNKGFDVTCEALNSWLKLDDCLWLDPPCFNKWFSLALARSTSVGI